MAGRGPLGAAFWAELASRDAAGTRREDDDGAELEAELGAACACGRAAFGDIALDDQTFVRHLARAVGVSETGQLWLAGLAIEDLYLACACLAGVSAAVVAFNARHGAAIRAGIARVVRDADAGEIEQQLLSAMLVGSATSPAKLGSYAGKAPLDRWLGVAAQRAALMSLRENRAEARARGGAAAEPAPSGHTHPEMAYLKERYRHAFEQALKEALARAPEQERVLLRMHLVNGLSEDKIGRMFGVSQATASRRLASAREGLLEDIKSTLGNRLGASPEEVASLAGLVASRLDLSLSLLLKTG